MMLDASLLPTANRSDANTAVARFLGRWIMGDPGPDLKERGRVIGTSYVYIQYTCFLLNCRSVFLHLFLLNQEASCSLLLD